MHKLVLSLAAVLAVTTMASAQQPRPPEEAAVVGPWRVEVITKNNKFDGCSMMRRANDVGATIIRAPDGLTLMLDSEKWKLERGKQYPVELLAGGAKWSARAAADRDSVSIPLTDTAFVETFRKADQLQVKGDGATIVVPLNQSAAALDRLDACFEKNNVSPESNPFVAPNRRP